MYSIRSQLYKNPASVLIVQVQYYLFASERFHCKMKPPSCSQKFHIKLSLLSLVVLVLQGKIKLQKYVCNASFIFFIKENRYNRYEGSCPGFLERGIWEGRGMWEGDRRGDWRENLRFACFIWK